MSFPEIKTEAEAEFIKQKNINIRWMDEKSEEEKKKQAIHIGLDDSGAATVARFARDHPSISKPSVSYFGSARLSRRRRR